MSELVDDGLMTKNEKMPSSTGDNNKEVSLLRELQKSIHFVKRVTPSHLPSGARCMMALPLWFTLKHGDKFQQTVVLRSGSSTESWRVQLNIFSKPPKSPEVKFAKGWRDFAASNGFIEGDELLFSLRKLSVFDVYVFRKSGNQIQPSYLQAPRKRPHDFDFSQEKVNRSSGCRDQSLNAERSEGSVDDLSDLLAKKKTVGELEGAVLPFHGTTTYRNSSNFNSHFLRSRNLRDPSSFRCDSLKGQEPPVQHEELVMPCTGNGSAQHIGARKSHTNAHKEKALEETRKSPTSFLKRLTASNFCSTRSSARLEIPAKFMRTYGSRVHTPIVKLQGIHERCPVRIVELRTWKSRLYLRDGWREFGDENCLKVGQELSFTLTADSFFVVRVNS